MLLLNDCFSNLKHDWILKVPQPTREHMKNDVADYMRYYNLEKLHTANNDMSPIDYENSLKKCPDLVVQNIIQTIPEMSTASKWEGIEIHSHHW